MDNKPLATMVVAIALALGLMTMGTAGALAQSAAAKPDEQTIASAYVYLLGRMLVIRQEQTDLKDPGFAYNTIKRNPLGSADFVNPNFDVASLEAWIAAGDAAVLLEVPEVKDRYYTVEILDEWGEVIANVNERTFPSKPYGKFALVKPGSRATIPPDAARIELHSGKAKMLGRVELKGDPDGAIALQKQFTVTPLGAVTVEPSPKIPDFGNKALLGAEIFDNVDAVLASALDVSPVAAEMQQKVRAVAAYVATSPEARAEVDKLLHEKVVPEFEIYAFTESGPSRNHWAGGAETGNYGKDYRVRTMVNYTDIWANTKDEVVYFVATRDADDKLLDGGTSYVIHFPADGLPGSVVNSYWSMTLVGVPDYRVTPNPLNRFNLNSTSKLANELDGSLKIAVGPKPVPGIPESNWLPSPAGKPFSLTFRTYVPKDLVKEGKWAPPAVTDVK
jgi:hypothetical protein